MRTISFVALLTVVIVASGCAHPLAIGPDISAIERDNGTQPIAKHIGYYIDPVAREKSVNTPGGGGDSVSYFPYKDIETAFYKMLSNVFQNVSLLKSPNDATAPGKQPIAYVITPEITTTSSSSSPFTWPPTQFNVTLACNIADASGKSVAKPSVKGEGKAEFEEFKTDFSLSGKRAALDALLKMQSALLLMPELRAQ